MQPIASTALMGISPSIQQNQRPKPVESCQRPPLFQLAPHFQGLTHQVKGRHWLSYHGFSTALDLARTPYIGQLPRAFVNAFSSNPKGVYEAFNEFASIARGLRGPEHIEYRFTLGETPITLTPIGSGDFGQVFKITLNGQSFALKLYHDYQEVKSHGIHAESAAGAYFSHWPMKDLAGFLFGNPKAGWAVFELIQPGASAQSRRGKRLRDFPVQMVDQKPENAVGNVWVDYGVVVHPKPSQIKSFTEETMSEGEFKAAIASNNLKDQVEAADKLYLLDGSATKAAFYLAMATHHPEVQSAVVSRIGCLPIDERTKAFYFALDCPDPEVKAMAAYQISVLPQDDREAAYIEAFKCPVEKVQVNTASTISALPQALRESAFQRAFATHRPKITASAIREWYSMPEDAIARTYELARSCPDDVIQKAIAEGISSLPSNLKLRAFQEAMATGNPVIQKIAANQISYMPNGTLLDQACEIAKSISTPEVQACVALNIFQLSEGLRYPMFQWAFGTKNQNIQATAARQIQCLPENVREDAFMQAFATQNPEVLATVANQISSLPPDFQPKALQMLFNSAMGRHEPQIIQDLQVQLTS